MKISIIIDFPIKILHKKNSTIVFIKTKKKTKLFSLNSTFEFFTSLYLIEISEINFLSHTIFILNVKSL